jgi:hypothetical protein
MRIGSKRGTPLTPLSPTLCPRLCTNRGSPFTPNGVWGRAAQPPPPFSTPHVRGERGHTWLHVAEMWPTPNPPPHCSLHSWENRVGWRGLGLATRGHVRPLSPCKWGAPADDGDCTCACAPHPFGAPHPLPHPLAPPALPWGDARGCT